MLCLGRPDEMRFYWVWEGGYAMAWVVIERGDGDIASGKGKRWLRGMTLRFEVQASSADDMML